MKIGQFVKAHIREIFSHCDTGDHNEIDFLLDPAYSKRTFGVNFPFCAAVEDIEKTESKRYWTDVYLVRGTRVRVTSQWFESSRPLFFQYLKSKNIEPKSKLENYNPTLTSSDSGNKVFTARSNSRYRGNAIGNAQNLFVRNILSRLGNESFSEKDWENTKDYFSRRCAYCNADADLLIEHAIPINKEKLGEHRLGNLVPSCKPCNSKKRGLDFREFLGDDLEAIQKIEAYMDSRNYVPLEDSEQMRMILDMAHKEVASLAARYIRIVNELFPRSSDPDSDDDQCDTTSI
ncbi:HNH endonuclease [Leptolyngbya sp. PCC 6406]|uniref:HNH endonuclease n=1 Tax=Leptolyngbya sp. PCC 6406 TaxID=1173264 RepID=UPI0002ABB898|nr:HNH endonuclease [Leptolyngbya sp. PCC 6406]